MSPPDSEIMDPSSKDVTSEKAATISRQIRDEESLAGMTIASSNRHKPSKRENQVIDVNTAMAEANHEQTQQDRALLKKTLRNVQPLLKRVPQLKLYEEKSKLFPQDDFEKVNLELVTLQMVMSKILQEIMSLKGANILFKDILHYNR